MKCYGQPRLNRHYLANEGPSSLGKLLVFPVVMYECESWTIKKDEHERIDAFELWCWTRLLRVPWTAKKANKSILKEISPEYSLEGQMLKPKLQYFGHMMWRMDSFEKTLILGKIEGGWGEKGEKEWDGWMASLTQWTWVCVNSGSLWWTRRPRVLQSMGSQESDMTEQLNWTELTVATIIQYRLDLVINNIYTHYLISLPICLSLTKLPVFPAHCLEFISNSFKISSPLDLESIGLPTFHCL